MRFHCAVAHIRGVIGGELRHLKRVWMWRRGFWVWSSADVRFFLGRRKVRSLDWSETTKT